MKNFIINLARWGLLQLQKIWFLLIFLLNPEKHILQQSYFPENKHKSRVSIFFDFIRHILKYGEIDKFYFAYGFDSKTHKEMDQYEPYYTFMIKRNRHNYLKPYNYVCILRNKQLFETVAKAYDIPAVYSLGCMHNNMVQHGEHQTSLKELLNKYPELFVKSISGECGEGVFYIEKHGDQIFLNSKISSFEDIAERLKEKYIVQPLLKQHDVLQNLHPNSVNTLRIVTIKRFDTVHVLSSILRIGTNGHSVDNWAQGGLAIKVNDNGVLDTFAYYKPGFGTKCEFHPDSLTRFDQVTIPYFHEALDLCIKFHSKLDINSIGWDVAITQKGPVFIEGNDNWEMSLMQVPCGPLKTAFNNFICERTK